MYVNYFILLGKKTTNREMYTMSTQHIFTCIENDKEYKHKDKRTLCYVFTNTTQLYNYITLVSVYASFVKKYSVKLLMSTSLYKSAYKMTSIHYLSVPSPHL